MSQSITIPTATRPKMDAGYGLDNNNTEGMLQWEWVSEQMMKSPNYWVATTRADGRPHSMPVWGVWLDNTLYFSTGRQSIKGRNLSRQSGLMIHLESGNDVVIIDGQVEEVTDRPLLDKVIETYTKKYAHKGFEPSPEPDPSGVWYAVKMHVVMAWLEYDFLKSAARWEFQKNEAG